MQKYIITMIGFLLISIGSWSQEQKQIKGKVMDAETRETLQGASITDGYKYAISDAEGNFSIQTEKDKLTVSYMGYTSRQIDTQSEYVEVLLQLNTDVLNAVVVTGYQTNRNLFHTAGAVSVRTQSDLKSGDGTSITPVLNTIPGVKMEEQAPGDYKISLRGSALRDPYGVRNLKMYWEDIPITSPDNSGSHSLNLTASQMGRIEVIKGPAGSIYGAGMGGVILFRNAKPNADENSLELNSTFGSFGLLNSGLTYKMNDEDMSISANYTHLDYDGYRQNEFSKSDAFNLFGKAFINEKRDLSFVVNHANGNYGIAGSVDKEWAMTHPRDAVPFAIENRTGVRKRSYTMVGLSQEYRFSKKVKNVSSVFTDFQLLDHPYGQSESYKQFLKQSDGGYGARTHFVYTPTIGNLEAKFILGDEIQYQNSRSSTFDLVNAKPGDLLMSNQVGMLSNIAFLQASLDLPQDFYLTAGASLNHLHYNITDLIPQSADYQNESGSVHFKNTFSPRIALVKTFGRSFAAHASASYGFSPPSIQEAKNADGSFNLDLEPEHGINYEVGVRGVLFSDKLNFDVSGYQMNLKEAILPFYNQFGGQSYRNSGTTDQKGIEATLYYLAIQDNQSFISFLKPWIAYSYSDYKFRNYISERFDYEIFDVVQADVSGKKVTGVSPHMFNAGLDVKTRTGIYFNSILNYVSKTPINDENTYHQDAYTLLSAKLGYEIPIADFVLDVFVGGNNLLNQKYSSWISFNADANSNPPEFYNPSPTANFYGGMNLKYNF